MLDNQPHVLSELFKVFALGHKVDVTQWTEIRVLYLADCSNQSYLLC
jgi:hypothetical protein